MIMVDKVNEKELWYLNNIMVIKAPQALYPTSLVKIHQHLLKLLSGNKNTGMSRSDNCVTN